MEKSPLIYWFRNDLRIQGNTGLSNATASGHPVIPVFIYDQASEGDWKYGSASKWWLHHSLLSLTKGLREFGSRIIIRSGNSYDVLHQLIKETGAAGVYWNRKYEPNIIERDKLIKKDLREKGLIAKSFNGSLLIEPEDVLNKSNNPFKVFTPFWKQCLIHLQNNEPKYPKPINKSALNYSPKRLQGFEVSDLKLLPGISWDTGISASWNPGEAHALQRFDAFCTSGLESYDSKRDIPSLSGTSRLSPHLHFGEISPIQIWHFLNNHFPDKSWIHSTFISEIGWREFAYNQLYHFNQITQHPLKNQFSSFPWENNQEHLEAWQEGRTGFPIVDAGMKELWSTGWMHNRVRMIAASFLVKQLLIPWQKGSLWFWDTLVDADLASNSLGWQWVSGCGADAAPYFRIFNPVLQGEKFDPDGIYIKKWLPELKNFPRKFIHKPWELSKSHQSEIGCLLGKDYPLPIVDLKNARTRALTAYKSLG